ncbi:MAG TPA: hypothetical protein VM658_01960 [bacterium]|nr:hypothetical protein [bacterium]
MVAASPEKLAEWLFDRLKVSPVSEFIPQENLHLICSRAMFFFYADGKLNAEGLIEWFQTEYDAPPHVVTTALNAVKDEAQRSLGVQILMPGAPAGAGPGAATDDARVTFAKAAPPEEPPPFDQAPGQAPAKPASPSAPEPEPEPEPPPKPEAGPAQPSAIAPRKAWEYMKPARRDPARNLGSFLHDSTYLEWAILDHAQGGDHCDDAILKSSLQEKFAFTPEEKSALAEFTLEPGKEGATAAAWCLRMNGIALACAYALELAASELGFSQEEWARGVRQLDATFGDLAIKILGKRAEARRTGEQGQEAFEAAFNRLKQIHDLLENVVRKRSSPAAAAPARSAPGKPASRPASRAGADSSSAARAAQASASGKSGLRSFINNNHQAILLAAMAVAVLSILATLYFSGVFEGSSIKDLEVDVSDSGLAALSVTGQDKTMVVVIDEDSWLNSLTGQKEDALKKLYARAAAMNYSQVQVRTREGGVLAHAWSDDNFKIFK